MSNSHKSIQAPRTAITNVLKLEANLPIYRTNFNSPACSLLLPLLAAAALPLPLRDFPRLIFLLRCCAGLPAAWQRYPPCRRLQRRRGCTLRGCRLAPGWIELDVCLPLTVPPPAAPKAPDAAAAAVDRRPSPQSLGLGLEISWGWGRGCRGLRE